MPHQRKRALIVGGGPVGALTALSLHKRGWGVELWEGREDPRGSDTSPAALRSINLAISSRGLEALKSVDPLLAESLLGYAIPMKGRMIHHTDGRQESQLYDPSGGQVGVCASSTSFSFLNRSPSPAADQCINSLPRPLLNTHLLSALPNSIALRFNTKLARIDFRKNVAYRLSTTSVRAKPGEEAVGEEGKLKADGGEGKEFDLVVGCDGSWSKVRSEMMRAERMDFSQSFIPHAYIELHMPPRPNSSTDGDDRFLIDKNHLHIWPRHSFMLIALPNQDGSFTLTLFAPFSSLAPLTTRAAAASFFDEHFPTALAWAGRDRILDDFEKNPRGSLVTINCSPCHHSSSALLLGDASHSMVPFYGQGLNCGLEDVRVLNTVLETHGVTSVRQEGGGEDAALREALEEYSRIRGEDLEAICELAMENYTEMRSHVLTPLHHLRRILDSMLSTILPPTRPSLLSLAGPAFPTHHVGGWSSLYSMVTFRPDVAYKEALRKERAQKKMVEWVGGGLGVGLVGAVVVGGWRFGKSWLERRI